MKATQQVEFPDWVKIPVSMQHQFFELEANEAQRTKPRLLEHKKRLNELRGILQFDTLSESSDWKDWKIAYIDGSDSPVLSRHMGGRFGTYAAGWNAYSEDELQSEQYFSGKMVDFETGDSS